MEHLIHRGDELLPSGDNPIPEVFELVGKGLRGTIGDDDQLAMGGRLTGADEDIGSLFSRPDRVRLSIGEGHLLVESVGKIEKVLWSEAAFLELLTADLHLLGRVGTEADVLKRRG